jgi:hypothetical protein
MSRLRSLGLPLGLLVLLCSSRASSAQVSAYGAIAVTGYGIDTNSTGLYEKSGSPGFVIGGFYNFPIDSRLTAGLDLRLTNSPGTKGGTAGAVAIRVGFVPHVVRLRPYLELGGGFVRTTTNAELINDGVRSGTYTNGALIITTGLDIRATHSIDIRALEIGGEAGGNSSVGFVDAGVVYHFAPRKH